MRLSEEQMLAAWQRLNAEMPPPNYEHDRRMVPASELRPVPRKQGRRCKGCGKRFIPKWNTTLYCGQPCAGRTKPTAQPCLQCGGPTPSPNRKTCSDACYKAYRTAQCRMSIKTAVAKRRAAKKAEPVKPPKPLRRPGAWPLSAEELTALIKEGLTVSAIAARLGVTTRAVFKRMNTVGVRVTDIAGARRRPKKRAEPKPKREISPPPPPEPCAWCGARGDHRCSYPGRKALATMVAGLGVAATAQHYRVYARTVRAHLSRGA